MEWEELEPEIKADLKRAIMREMAIWNPEFTKGRIAEVMFEDSDIPELAMWAKPAFYKADVA